MSDKELTKEEADLKAIKRYMSNSLNSLENLYQFRRLATAQLCKYSPFVNESNRPVVTDALVKDKE